MVNCWRGAFGALGPSKNPNPFSVSGDSRNPHHQRHEPLADREALKKNTQGGGGTLKA